MFWAGYEEPPDGGWGWMIVVAAFFIRIFTTNLYAISPVLLVEISDSFNNNSRFQVTWIFALFMFIWSWTVMWEYKFQDNHLTMNPNEFMF